MAKLGVVLSPTEKKWIQIKKLLSSSILIISCEEDDWRTPIFKYLKGEKLDLEPIQVRKIKNQAINFTTIKEELVRRNIKDNTLPYMLCVSKEEGKAIAISIHNGANGAHQGGRNLTLQVQKQGYFWPQIKGDITDIVKKCKECQIHANIQRASATNLTSIITSVPFAR